MSVAQRSRSKKPVTAGQIIGESKAEREFQRTLDRWVQGRAQYADVVRAIPGHEPDAMVWLGRKIRRALRLR